MKGIRNLAVFAAAFAMVAVVAPQPADACGGFFCSSVPIDQTAEQIIFTYEDGMVSAYIQVSFSGSAEDFAWIVPVSSVPELDVAEAQIFQNLNFATAPNIIPPNCLFDDLMMDGNTSGPAAEGSNGGRGSGGVIVYDVSDVGPFEIATIGSDDGAVLVAWLEDNGYRITEAMYPIVNQYVDEGMLFVAMKLQPGQGVDALQPVVMTYEGEMPVIPLRLTAVATEPNMGVLVWVLGDSRAAPANYADVGLDLDRLRFDGFLQSNYRQLVTQTVDEAGGQAWITEYAAPTAELMLNVFDEPTLDLLDRYDYITRFYNTMNAEEMTVDPMFTFNPNLPDVSNMIDLSNRDDLCEVTTSPCDFNYCGPDSTCYEAGGAAACECADGQVARGVNGQNGPEVSCVPNEDLLGDLGGDPCASSTCGEFGSCVAINGQATCACEAGYGATDNGGSPTCIDISLATPATNQPPSLAGSNGGSEAGDEMGCAVGGTNSSLPALALLGLIAGLVIRRRR